MGVMEIVVAVAIVMATMGWWRVGRLRKAVAEGAEEMASLRSHVAASNNILEQKILDVRSSIGKREDKSNQRFHAEMTVDEVLNLHPDAASVMANFHLGGCSSCAISEHHVLGPACEGYGIDVEPLLEALNALLDGGPIPAMQPRGENLIQIDSSG